MPRTNTRSKGKRWSYSAGEWDRNRVRVYERTERGDLILQYAEPQPDGELRQVRVFLGRCPRDEAKTKVDEIAAKFAAVTAADVEVKPLTLRALFDSYEREMTPDKAAGTQRHDRTTFALFLRCFRSRSRQLYSAATSSSAGRMIGIPVYDHVIIGNGRFFSFLKEKWL